MDHLRRCMSQVTKIPDNLQIVNERDSRSGSLEPLTDWKNLGGIRDFVYAVSCKDTLHDLDIEKISKKEKDQFIKDNVKADDMSDFLWYRTKPSLWKDILYNKNSFDEFINVLDTSNKYKLNISTYIETTADFVDIYKLKTNGSIFDLFWGKEYTYENNW